MFPKNYIILFYFFILVVLRVVMNNHKHAISNAYMRLVIHWVEDETIYVMQESKRKIIDFSFLGTLQKIIDLYQPSVQTRPPETHTRKQKMKKTIKEILEQTPHDGVENFHDIAATHNEVTAIMVLIDLHMSG